MTLQDKELLLQDLCARLPYNVIVDYSYNVFDVYNGNHVFHNSKCILTCSLLDVFISPRRNEKGEYIKPYLFPLSSMTEEQAKELSILHGIKDILSIKITDEYIDFEVDDGFGGIGIKPIWYDDTISSIETFDWCNKNHFDYRGLIEKGLAIDATNLNIYKTSMSNNPQITIGTKIRSKTKLDEILTIISDDCHEDKFECSDGSVLSLKQIKKYYDII